MPANSVKRLFWGWDRPVLEKAVAFLSHGRNASRALDLSDTLIIVPTAEAGRRLKEALARSSDSGVLAPWVWTAEQALLPAGLRMHAASAAQSHMAWLKVIQKTDMGSFTALFPVQAESPGWAWQTSMASLLGELNSLLGAGGVTFEAAAATLETDAARWHDLASLASLYESALENEGLQDVQALKRRGSESPWLPPGVERVVVVAAPDLPPLFARWLHNAAVSVIICVQAPELLAHAFDTIGRPLPAFWGEDTGVELPLAESQIQLCRDASSQAAQVLQWLRLKVPLGRAAIGLADAEAGAALAEKLTLEKVNVFEPGGDGPAKSGLWHLLQQFHALIKTRSWRSLTTLLRIPEMRTALMAKTKGGLSLLEEADDFSMEHLLVTVDHAYALCPEKLSMGREAERPSELRPVLAATIKLLDEIQSGTLEASARALLLRLYGERRFSPNAPDQHSLLELADAWLSCCREVDAETHRFGLNLSFEESFQLSLQMLAQVTLSPQRGDVDLVLQGWLELLWEPAPFLIVAGLNEENVPGIQVAHPFLPDSARRLLALPDQSGRFARDSYLLHSLASQRQGPGAGLHVTLGAWTDRGDPLRPSRLLFACSDEGLPARVNHLFPKQEHSRSPGESEPQRTLAWPMEPRMKIPQVETISPSRLRSYLQCPFRDYLSHELRMESTEPLKRELAPNEFGTLAHHALQALATDHSLRTSTNVREISDFLITTAMEEAHRLYGRPAAPLVELQLESLRQRLAFAAETEAAEREQGWVIYQTEWEPPEENPLLIEGARLRCKVDRIDRHATSGHLRVLDYKTGDRVISPMDAHLRKIRPQTRIPEAENWKCFAASTGSYQWKDLQIPLYAAALRLQGLMPQQAGYFMLPKSVQETKVVVWEDFTEEWVTHALDCAAEVVRRLREGRFWPPGEKAFDRGFDELFLGDLTKNAIWRGAGGQEERA